MAYSSDELEVVAYEGDWMKVALGGDTYGYVNAYYVGYDTYYATAETLEEEQARLDQEWLDYLAEQEAEQAAAEQAWLDYLAEQEAEQQTWDTEYEYQAPVETTPTVTETVTTTDAQATANALYQAYLEAQAAADQATTQGDEQAVYDTAAAAQEAYQRYLEAQAIADQQYYQTQDTTTTYEEPTYTYEEPTYEDTYYEEPTYEETYEEPTYEETYEEPVYEETNSLGQQIVNYATQFVGNPYVYGGTSLTNGADCSGFTQSVFANFGISLPRTAAAQSGSGTAVDLSNIQAGDLLFYSDGSGISHVSIYMGNGQVVHASSSTTGIIISDVGYRTPVCARRYY
jgi:cell wall-associated NlpC family hydrolase